MDTNICIYVIKQRPLTALARFNEHAGQMAVSSITVAKLLHRAHKSQASSRALDVVEDCCSCLEVLSYGAKAAEHYGNIPSALEKKGEPIGVNDLHIAARARSEGLTLVSNNPREFERVEALLVANWVEG
ncbi:PIN domain-containing protein [Paucibacter sp. PLA-PC-4]|uniref:PIN domain-containing protein n=1 Tax=Paucibacter sp. PLA-PC-4 TaxID=2993655 RepID=UPI002248E17E|nr:PIN domain-containing protein [Paucibacter sp. PLA-PC-4]MCX2862130.1 PIN domain-containing protein [Paucibacter sp. PLA-PC-4]